MPFVLTWFPSHGDLPPTIDPEDALTDTDEFWREWVGACKADIPDEWRAVIVRSLVVLKALTYEPTGGIVAAPTTSLPEWIGGVRNWDYRYCWLRDATLTLLALPARGLRGGGARVAHVAACAPSPAIPPTSRSCTASPASGASPSSSCRGSPATKGSAPVRIGNAASEQLQLDVFGEVVDALYQAARARARVPEEPMGRCRRCWSSHLEEIWREPDEGIWEIRGERRHFVHSKVMAWVAFDRAVRSVEEHAVDGPVERWRALRDEIHADVCAKGFDEELGSFVQSYGSKELDASLLLIPLVGFLPASDPTRSRHRRGDSERTSSSTASCSAIARRKATSTGSLPVRASSCRARSGSSTASSCSAGSDEAVALFDRLVGLANDVGLLAEEYDPRSKRLLGNFPQAFTHLALVNSAFNVLQHLPSPMHRRHAHRESRTQH